MGSLERRYAEALLSLAENAEQADIVDSALGVLGRLYTKSAEFRGLMLNPVISINNRSETLLDILEMLGYIKNGTDMNICETTSRKRDIYAETGNETGSKSGDQKNTADDRNRDIINGISDAGMEIEKEILDMVSGASEPDTDDPLDDIMYDQDADDITEMDIETTAIVADAGVLLLRFLQLLLDKGRLAFLPNIAEEYHRIKANNRNNIRIIVRSSSPLENKTLIELRDKYQFQYGAANAEIDNIIDTSLLSGISVQIGDIRVDETLYGRLAELARAVAAGAVKQTVGTGYIN